MAGHTCIVNSRLQISKTENQVAVSGGPILTTCSLTPQSAAPFLVLVVLMKSNTIITYIVAVAVGVSVAAAFLLPW